MGLMDKRNLVKEKIKTDHGCDGICSKCVSAQKLIDLMFDANIPFGYWFLSMKNFSGAQEIKDIYDKYTSNINETYSNGTSICFAGNQGTGKTMSSICILKRALKVGFSAYYITASDILNNMTDFKNCGEFRLKLRDSDFLVIDELDSRFFVSDSVKELFSGIYENIFRFRAHNMMPTIICTNEIDGILGVFYGQAKQAIDSLNKQYLKICPVAGADFRKKGIV